jgi:hypothetical protein
VTTTTAAGTISPAPLTVTATPNTKVYDGEIGAAALPLIIGARLPRRQRLSPARRRNAGGQILNPTA